MKKSHSILEAARLEVADHVAGCEACVRPIREHLASGCTGCMVTMAPSPDGSAPVRRPAQGIHSCGFDGCIDYQALVHAVVEAHKSEALERGPFGSPDGESEPGN
jgi:hypothetical protein